MKKRVLILCTGNSCRSQIAEGLWRSLAGDEWEAYSAGSRPAGFVHPLAVQVMAECGIDISAHRSKHLDEYSNVAFDLVVTVCDSAKESCPVLPGAGQSLHWPFDDPAEVTGSEAEILDAFHEVRDRIRERIGRYLQTGQ
jgi:arsenate reductase